MDMSPTFHLKLSFHFLAQAPIKKDMLLVPHGEREQVKYPISHRQADEQMLWTNPDGIPLETYHDDGSKCRQGCQQFIDDRTSSILIVTEYTEHGLIFLFKSNMCGVLWHKTLQRGT